MDYLTIKIKITDTEVWDEILQLLAELSEKDEKVHKRLLEICEKHKLCGG